MKKIDVLVVGELNVDIILNKIQGFPEIGKEIISKELNVTLGSSSAIFACNLSSLETKVAFMGKIGNDNFSDLIIESLRAKRVNTDLILSSEQFKTGLTIVMNYDMDRANVTYPGAMEHLLENEVSDNTLSQAKHLHVSSIFLQTGLINDVTALFKRAKKLGLTTSMDPQWDPNEKWEINLPELLPYIDVFMPNAIEFKYLTNCVDIEKGLQKVKSYSNVIVIKDGENGSHLWNGTTLITKEAFINKNIVDCIGAGDSFNSGFISEYLKGKSLVHCLERGNLTGAINTTASGGTTAFVDIDEIAKIAKSKFQYKF